LELAGLKNLENTLVISLTNDLSLDKEKRLAIATELVANPSVLFLDDPLKALDSLNAVQIATCLKVVLSLSIRILRIMQMLSSSNT
jgi:ABC-type multidrug transport system ATPase subunit